MTALPMESVENLPSQNIYISTKKRKRFEKAPEELEVDIHAPEPPSKKALRKAKKAKVPITANPFSDPDPQAGSLPNDEEASPAPQVAEKSEEKPATSKRSAYGIWTGNLLYTTSKDDLRAFLTTDTKITDTIITRIHMPTPTDATSLRQKVKPQNKGFAYVDFSTPEALVGALALSETLLAGRKVLIKDAKNFEGRPDKQDEATTATKSRPSGKPPSKRIFVGNLAFDTDKEDLEEHFARCGEVVDVHIATFEDSGKCKGYGWVTFANIDAAEAAVKGWVVIKAEDSAVEAVDEEDDESPDENKERVDEAEPARSKKNKKRPKDRKWWVNKFKGRPLRMEFAEDASLRYKKRFGKDATSNGTGTRNPSRDERTPQASVQEPAVDELVAATSMRPENRIIRPQRPAKTFDARNVKPGAAHAAAPRSTGGIIPSQGRKTTFV